MAAEADLSGPFTIRRDRMTGAQGLVPTQWDCVNRQAAGGAIYSGALAEDDCGKGFQLLTDSNLKEYCHGERP